LAAELIGHSLPREHPLWTATLVTEIAPGEAALILVFHHVVADGIGGLAVLASLVDGAPLDGDAEFPQPRPSNMQLAVDAARERIRSLRQTPAAMRRMGSAVAELRPAARSGAVRTSLNRPTGTRRRFAGIRLEVGRIHRIAHAHGATVNDVVLTATADALHRLLVSRGEHADEIVISVPFSPRREASAGDLGNLSGVIPLAIPTVGDLPTRLAAVAALTRAAKRKIPGASTALLGPLFRLLARVGLYQRFITRQRMIHTFVSALRGPETQLSLVGCPITAIVPLSTPTGNVTVSFVVLSYAGVLAVTIAADPEGCPDLLELQVMLTDAFDAFEALEAPAEL
jgi:WS/DGAT/MGAT family acyltransferase